MVKCNKLCDVVRYILFKCVHYFFRYAISEGNVMVKIFKNFKQKTAFKPDFGAEGELYFLFCHLTPQFVFLCMDTACISMYSNA